MKLPRLPARGGFVAPAQITGHFVDVWFNREERSWVVQLKDAAGSQIGPCGEGEAVYTHDRESAVREARFHLATAGDVLPNGSEPWNLNRPAQVSP